MTFTDSIQRLLPGLFNDDIIIMNISENSEERYGIVKQPSPTCPMIDDVINALCNEDYEKIAPKLEAIRGHVKSIRDWGQQWKDFAKENVKL